MILDKETVAIVKKESKELFARSAFDSHPKWEDFYNIFKESYAKGKADLSSPSTLTIDNSESYSDIFDSIIERLSSIHDGEKIAVLSIIHFLNANDNTVPEAAGAFCGDFMSANPNKLPPGFDFNLFQPTVHSDPVDGFYIQCEGQTTWRVFHKNRVNTYLVNPGDAIYIPKGIDHSVESMNVRAAISVSFFDKE